MEASSMSGARRSGPLYRLQWITGSIEISPVLDAWMGEAQRHAPAPTQTTSFGA
jgi:hypothetical protein